MKQTAIQQAQPQLGLMCFPAALPCLPAARCSVFVLYAINGLETWPPQQSMPGQPDM